MKLTVVCWAMQVNAMATFNILAQEGRHVVGALLPVSFSAASAPT